MRTCCLTFLLCCAFTITHAQNLLSHLWQIQKGQDTGVINIGISLERQGYPCFSGEYVLTNQVVIPTGNVRLQYKLEAEQAQIFLNGTAIDSSGTIPDALIKRDQLNTITARIYNTLYTGGTCANFIHLIHSIVVNSFHDTVSAGNLPPGFYQQQEGEKISWFAVSPEKINVTPKYRNEVLKFWEETKKELAAIPPKYKLQKVDSLSTTHNVYIVEMQSLENITVRGWYITPLKPGVYPAVLHLPGYSVSMDPKRCMQDTDIIHLALDIRGHGMSADKIHPGFGLPGYVGYQIADPKKYIYRGAFMDACRAVDFLLSRKDVDTSRIAVEGHSQGGGLSLATAALCGDKIKYCVTASPFLCDFADHVKIRTIYGDEMAYYQQENHLTQENLYHTMNYFDNINLAGAIKCPVLMGVGLFDDDCPPYIGFAAFNNINTPREYRIYHEDGHLLGHDWQKTARIWLRSRFGLKD